MTGIKALIAVVLLVCSMGCGYGAPNVTARYSVPLEEDLQIHIIRECEQRQIDSAIVFAVIEIESHYDIDAMGDSGKAYGLMQVQERWHRERIAKLGVTDLLDPYQNVSVGIDYLAECIERNGLEKGLMVYNAGQQGAQRMWFNHGVYSNEYSRKVLEAAQIIAEGAYADADT